MRRICRTKNQYQQRLFLYNQRRDEVRKKYSGTPEYAKRVATINQMIWNCNRALKNIEKYEAKLEAIDKLLKEFIGRSVWKRGSSYDKTVIDAKNVFYRHCMEHRIPCSYIAKYCGLSKSETPAIQRKVFIRSFATNTHNRELWYRWKEYLQREDLAIAA